VKGGATDYDYDGGRGREGGRAGGREGERGAGTEIADPFGGGGHGAGGGGAVDIRQEVARADWQLFIGALAHDIVQEQSPQRLLQCRSKFYEVRGVVWDVMCVVLPPPRRRPQKKGEARVLTLLCCGCECGCGGGGVRAAAHELHPARGDHQGAEPRAAAQDRRIPDAGGGPPGCVLRAPDTHGPESNLSPGGVRGQVHGALPHVDGLDVLRELADQVLLPARASVEGACALARGVVHLRSTVCYDALKERHCVGTAVATRCTSLGLYNAAVASASLYTSQPDSQHLSCHHSRTLSAQL
jgi:hypothetical protein